MGWPTLTLLAAGRAACSVLHVKLGLKGRIRIVDVLELEWGQHLLNLARELLEVFSKPLVNFDGGDPREAQSFLVILGPK